MKGKAWDTIFSDISRGALSFFLSSIPQGSTGETPPKIIVFFAKSSDFTMLLSENVPFSLPPTKATFPNPLRIWLHSGPPPAGLSFLFPQKVEKASPLFSTRFGNPSRLDPAREILHIINHS
jgi:hypothetical protein